MSSGKTWLLSRLFHKQPPDLYTSTGIAEQSLRGLLHHMGNMSIGSWKLLSHKDIREILAPCFLAGMTEANVAALAADLIAMDAADTPSLSSDTATSDSLPLSSFQPLPETHVRTIINIASYM